MSVVVAARLVACPPGSGAPAGDHVAPPSVEVNSSFGCLPCTGGPPHSAARLWSADADTSTTVLRRREPDVTEVGGVARRRYPDPGLPAVATAYHGRAGARGMRRHARGIAQRPGGVDVDEGDRDEVQSRRSRTAARPHRPGRLDPRVP